MEIEHLQSLRKAMKLHDSLLELSEPVVRDVKAEQLGESLDNDSQVRVV